MRWIEKLRILRGIFDKSPIGIDVLFKGNGWIAGEIEEVSKPYSFLADSYLKLLKEYDAFSIGGFRMRGSKKNKMSLEHAIRSHKDILGDDFFPFGDDFGGNIYLFNKKGDVLFWDQYDYNFEKRIVMASSFDEFMENLLSVNNGKKFEWINSERLDRVFIEQGWS